MKEEAHCDQCFCSTCYKQLSNCRVSKSRQFCFYPPIRSVKEVNFIRIFLMTATGIAISPFKHLPMLLVQAILLDPRPDNLQVRVLKMDYPRQCIQLDGYHLLTG
mmetsp:Transcript_50526/g.105549  ORF Transcript_50526/g.105549 Transcript_50526/m.105549 type:complete len:105 (+) Transcript_50526:210-524(+)